MSFYRYIGLNQMGQRETGVIEASARRAAADDLRNQGLRIIELAEDFDAKSDDVFVVINKYLPVSNTQKIFFFRQLALMLKAGLSLSEALEIQKNLAKGRMRAVIDDVSDRVRSGDSLSDSLEAQNQLFTSMSVQMIRSAEATGELDSISDRIADHMERKQDMTRQTFTTLLYPGITMLIALGMFYFLVSIVIPKFAEFFIKSGKRLPEQTQSLVDVSNFFSDWGLVILGIIISVSVIISRYYKKPDGRYKIDSLLLKVPIVGSVITISSMAQICLGLSMLLRSGLTLIESMSIIKNLVSNRVISTDIDNARQRVLSGKDLGTSLSGTSVTPLVTNLSSVGEKSGGLVDVMEEAGKHYEEALKAKSKILSSMMEPISILLIGGMVGYVYIAFFKAIFAMSG